MGVLAALRIWAPPVATMAVVSVSLSLSMPLFSLLLDRAGASATMVGVNHTIAALAIVATSLVLPRVLARTGLVWMMLFSLVLLALSTITIPLWDSAWWWGFLRIGWGIAGTALFYASEFWLVSATPEATRGRIVGFYVLILSGSYMLGPLLLNLLGTEGLAIYLVPTLIILAAAVPVIFGRAQAPLARSGDRPGADRLLRFFASDPAILWGVVLFGVIEFGAVGLVVVWGLASGFDQETSVNFVFWVAFGSMAFQLPVGWAADRYDRRKLLAIAGAVSFAMPLAIVATSHSVVFVSLFATIWGGMAVSCYALALTELGARYSGAILAQANAAVVLAYGIGALFGPTAFGGAMDVLGPDGLLWLSAVLGGAYFVLAVLRIVLRPRETLDSPGQSGS